MLMQFSVKNFLSFKELVTLNLVASAKNELEDSNVFLVNEKIRLLKSAVIYGANASGKSNLFKAMRFMRGFVLNSAKEMQATEEIMVSNFKLSTETENMPSSFEAVFILENIRYRYGFKVDRKEVYEEWLFYLPAGRRKETKLFLREKDNFDVGVNFSKESKGLSEKTRKNALFLSVVAQFNGEISIKILEWFKKFRVISGLRETGLLPFTVEKLKVADFKDQILNFLRIADFGIDDIKVEETEVSPDKIPETIRATLKSARPLINVTISTLHKKFDKERIACSSEKFDLEIEESDGTRKFFAISAPILDSLKNSYIIGIDELDSRLHPLLTQFIVKLFNSKEHNSLGAQLIFASHDTNFLSRNFFRRDQVWFVEKDQYGATDLYSLLEYRVRKDTSFGKDYVLGKYGAIPFIGNAGSLFRKTR